MKFLGYTVCCITQYQISNDFKLNLVHFLQTAYKFGIDLRSEPRKWWASHPKGRLVVPFVLGAALVGFSFLPDPAYDGSLPDIPAQMVIDNQTVPWHPEHELYGKFLPYIALYGVL